VTERDDKTTAEIAEKLIAANRALIEAIEKDRSREESATRKARNSFVRAQARIRRAAAAS